MGMRPGRTKCGHKPPGTGSEKVQHSLMVVSVDAILAVVAMVPLPKHANDDQLDHRPRFFVVEKPGLDVLTLGGHQENDSEDGEQRGGEDSAES